MIRTPRNFVVFLIFSIFVAMLLLTENILKYPVNLVTKHKKLKGVRVSPFKQEPQIQLNKNQQNFALKENDEETLEKSPSIEIDEGPSDGIEPETSVAKKVLVVAYMRSGSSLVGKLLEQSEDSIYFFEPLRVVQWPRSNDWGTLVSFEEVTSRNPTQNEREEIRLKVLRDLLSCKLRSTFKNIFMDRSKTSDHRFSQFYKCVGVSLDKVDHCLPIIQNLCDNSQVRIAKVIRLNTDVIGNLLKKMPDLKVIHLLRDPRAILNSRQNMRFGANRRVSTLCGLMERNIVDFEKIHELYPQRTATLFYEALVEQPVEVTKHLYDFIEVPMSNAVIEWVNTNMHGRYSPKGSFSVQNKNALRISNKWRTQLKFPKIASIDYKCETLYKLTGYLKVKSPQCLHDKKILHFKSVTNQIVSDIERLSKYASQGKPNT